MPKWFWVHSVKSGSRCYSLLNAIGSTDSPNSAFWNGVESSSNDYYVIESDYGYPFLNLSEVPESYDSYDLTNFQTAQKGKGFPYNNYLRRNYDDDMKRDLLISRVKFQNLTLSWFTTYLRWKDNQVYDSSEYQLNVLGRTYNWIAF